MTRSKITVAHLIGNRLGIGPVLSASLNYIERTECLVSTGPCHGPRRIENASADLTKSIVGVVAYDPREIKNSVGYYGPFTRSASGRHRGLSLGMLFMVLIGPRVTRE